MKNLQLYINSFKRKAGAVFAALIIAIVLATTGVTMTACPEPNTGTELPPGPGNPSEYDADDFHKITRLHKGTGKLWNWAGIDYQGKSHLDTKNYIEWYIKYMKEDGTNTPTDPEAWGLYNGAYYFSTNLERYLNGYDKDGYDEYGFNSNNFDREGYHRDGYTVDGWDRSNVNKTTNELWDLSGWTRNRQDMRGTDDYKTWYIQIGQAMGAAEPTETIIGPDGGKWNWSLDSGKLEWFPDFPIINKSFITSQSAATVCLESNRDALVRQALYLKEFFEEEAGRNCNNAVLAKAYLNHDAFGNGTGGVLEGIEY